MLCHVLHGSPNTNLLNVSEPALCLQCHSGHHNGASLPIPDRCTNCHGSIHGTDVATPTGGSRFVDKGPCGVPSVPTGSGVCGAPSGVGPAGDAVPASQRSTAPHVLMRTSVSANPSIQTSLSVPVASHPPTLGLWAGVFGAGPAMRSMAALPQASSGTQGTPGEVLAKLVFRLLDHAGLLPVS
jgi:predicted CXXCH cytochrome family protein